VVELEHKTAFLSFFRAKDAADYLALSANEASLAYDAVLQLEAGIKEVEKRLKHWSSANGSINLHEESYGWRDETAWVIDKSEVLRVLYDAGLQWEDIAKAVNISKSSIEKLPQKLQDAKDLLTATAKLTTKKRFGLIAAKN
jgi:hypothetical protein